MKKLVLLVLLATGLAVNARAVITAGLEAGYFTDGEDAYWAGRVGWQFKTSSALSHQVELELGYTEHSESIDIFTGKLELTPVTINYRAETTAANKLGFYFGAGLGQAKVRVKFTGSGVPNISDSDNALAVQAFAGVTYRATPTVSLHAGVKYLRIDDATIFDVTEEVGDDFAITGGVSIRF